MADLSGQQLKDSYQNLLTIDATIESNPLSGQLENGLGNAITALGIGTDSPSYPLTVKVDSATGIKVLHGNDSSVFQVDSFGSTGTDAGALLRMYNEAGDATVQIDTRSGGTRHTYFNNGGNVGIGNDSPDTKLEVGTAGDSAINMSGSADGIIKLTGAGYSFAIANNDTGTFLYNNGSSRALVFGNNETERMRIDSSGTVQVRNQTPTIQLYNTDTSLGNEQTLGDLDWYQNDPSGSGVNVVAKIRGVNESSFQGQGALAFHVGASGSVSEKVRIDSSGNVGIGTTSITSGISTSSKTLHIAHTNVSSVSLDNTNQNAKFELASIDVSGGALSIRKNTSSGTSGATELMRIDSDGNVGIGNTMSLSYSGESTGNGGELSLGNDSGDFESVLKLIGFSNDADSVVSTIDFLDKRNLDCIAKIISSRDTTTFGKGNIRFETASASGTLNEAMRIDSSGNVGIGTSPSEKLHIIDSSNPGNTSGSVIIEGRRDGVANTLTLRAKDASAPTSALPNGQGSVLRWQGFDGTDFENMGYILVSADGQAVADGDAPSFMAFGTSADGSSNPTERFRIDSSGRMGIGETNPDRELDLKNSADNCITSITSSTSHISGLVLGDTDDDDRGGILYNNTSDYLYFLSNAQERLRIDSSGNVLVGTEGVSDGTTYFGSTFRADSNSRRTLNMATSVTTAQDLVEFFNPAGRAGYIQINASTTSYVTSSDYRLKENVVDMTSALDRVDQLKPSRFNFIADADTTVDGFLAHEVADVVPEAISGEKDAVDEEGNPIYQGIDQSKLVPLLVGAIQELRAEIEQLKNQ
jgi:hypothetical protein